MRWVYEHEEGQDRSPGRRFYRKMMTENPKEFSSQMAKMEAEYQKLVLAAVGKSAVARSSDKLPVEDDDDGGLEVVEQWLKEHAEREAVENAELAKRPDAARLGASLQRALNATLDRERILKNTVDDLREKVQELAQRNGA
jgi:hypothetical protein